ncbi:MAG: hypothetical protein IPJ85_10910 [Flavobacteriales bacterium]|nr:hypothetical protein [Flavobacteriales bacterium]
MQVNEANRRTLQFQGDEDVQGDETPFFALGPNLGLHRLDHTPGYDVFKLHRRDLRLMSEAMEKLRDVGANFTRIHMKNLSFAPERVNLGVYDAFLVPQFCDTDFPSICGNGGWITGRTGNCQYQCWAFDQLVNTARVNDIYILLCIDPDPAVVDYQRFLGDHPHVAAYLEPYRDTPINGNPWDLKRFLYSNVDPSNTMSARLYDSGAFYYWKRKYKYIMSRWGYSVNIPIIEPINEIDQMLSYGNLDCSPDLDADDPCANNSALCQENRVPWVEDTTLHAAVNDWFSDIANYVRGDVDWNDPADSPLGEKNKLFLASFAGGDPNQANAASYYAVFSNPDVDIIDAHKGLHHPWDLSDFNAIVEEYRDNFTSNGLKKPFNSGEFSHYAKVHYNGKDYDLTPYFHNYEIAFHNELWSSAFSGKFAAGTSWHWGRVFWWPDAQDWAPPDDDNTFISVDPQGHQFDNRPYEWNRLNVDGYEPWVQNRPAYHNFKPLSDLLNHPSWQAYEFFNGDYKVGQWTGIPGNDLEAYYLQNGSPTELSTLAIGWVRNVNSSLFKSYYLASSEHEFLSCTPPNPASTHFALGGFLPGEYHVTWFPTRWNSTIQPADGQISTLFSSSFIILDLPGQFGGIENNFLDTLRGDYAFIITPDPLAKSRPPQPQIEANLIADWDFSIYPNPAREGFTLSFQDDSPKRRCNPGSIGQGLSSARRV